MGSTPSCSTTGGRGFLDSEFVLGVEPRRHGRTAQPWFALDCDEADREHKHCENQGGSLLVYGALGTRSSALFDVEGRWRSRHCHQ